MPRLFSIIQRADIATLDSRRGGAWDEDEHEAHHEDKLYPDFHIWLDADNAKKIVKVIVRELSAIYPENKITYKKNAEELLKRINELDERLKNELANVKNKPFIVFHDAYQYFERRYGLMAVGSITLEPNEPPSANRVTELRNKIKQTGASCVFREPYFSDRLVQTVIEGSEVKSEMLDPEATALEPGKDLYFTLLENLGASISKCLQN